MEVKRCGEATGVARDSEVPRAATAQPLKSQPSRQEGEETTDGGSATSEVPRAATVQPQTTPTCARPGSPSCSHAVTHTQGVDEPPAAIQQVSNATADAANPYATCTGPTRPADGSQNPPDDEVESGETADEDCRARTKRIDGRPSQVEASEDETTTTTTPDAPPRTPLEGKYAPQASDGSIELTVRKSDQAKATRDQGQTATTTSASTRSASCDHPTETETTTDLGRPSEDPADATGDDERRPDEPTEPPDKPEGMGWRGSEQRVGEVELRVSRASTEGAEAAGDDGDEERRPVKPNEPPDRPQVESTDPANIQVEPGGETDAERNGSVAHESADAGVDGEVVGMRRDVQDVSR